MGLMAPLRRDQASPLDSKIIRSYFYYLLAPFPSTGSHIPCLSCSSIVYQVNLLGLSPLLHWLAVYYDMY